MDRRRFGFPLHMLVGFAAGAGVAIVAAFVLAPDGRRILYGALVKLLFALGGAGTYVGHVVSAVRHKEAGIEPFGAIPPGILLFGAAIVLLGSFTIFGAVFGVMTALYGPSPH